MLQEGHAILQETRDPPVPAAEVHQRRVVFLDGPLDASPHLLLGPDRIVSPSQPQGRNVALLGHLLELLQRLPCLARPPSASVKQTEGP